MGKSPPSNSESTLEQRLMSLERLMKDQQESHQRKLASFLAANVALWEENATLQNAVIPIRHPDIPTAPHSPMRFESTYNFSFPPRRDHLPPPQRSMDLTLRVLDDMSSSLFVLAILSYDAPLHFALPKF